MDAFRRTRWRLGATFPNLVPFPPWPVARIDYVLTTPAITPEHAEVLPAAGSDHLGVGVVLRMPQVKLDPARAREAAEPER